MKNQFKKMVLAQIVSGMTVLLCLLIDSIMIGRFLGVMPLAAYGLANPLLLAFGGIGSMISAGAQVLCSQAVGKADKKGMDSIYTIVIGIITVVSIVGVAAVVIFAKPITVLLGAAYGDKIFFLTKDYLVGFIIGAPAFLFANVLVPFLQLSGKQSRLVGAVLCMIVSDIVFDLVSVFVFKGGMFGMGIASSLSYYVACLAGIWYFLGKDCMFHFHMKYVNWKNVFGLFYAGIPTIINMFSLVLLSYTLNQIMIQVGEDLAVAAYSIVNTIANMCYAFTGGIGGVTLMLAGVSYSEKNKKSLYNLMRLSLRYEIAVNGIVMVIVFVIAPILVKVFLGEDQSASALAVSGTRMLALSLIPSALNTGIKHFYQGTQRIRYTEFLSVLQNYVGIAAFAFLFSRFLGVTGVWLGYIFGELAVLSIIFLVVVVGKKKSPFKAESLAMLKVEIFIETDR